MRLILIAVLLALPAARVRAGEVADVNEAMAARIADPEVRAATLRLLRERGADYGARAIRAMRQRGEFFDYARVEITGVNSHHNTDLFDNGRFDRQIKPSFSARPNSALDDLRRRVESGESGLDLASEIVRRSAVGSSEPDTMLLDIADYAKASKGVMTPRALEVIGGYVGKEINEIVAHSWGCELIYAAIFNGVIAPPKKLIVVGVPDSDHAKWEMLAARTGTEVHWARATNDKVAISAGATIARVANRNVDYAAQWAARCPQPQVCNRYNRTPKPVVYEPVGALADLLGHDRGEYYEILKRNHVIEGKALDLRRAQSDVKAVETRNAGEAAYAEALRTIQTHDAKVRAILAEYAARSCADPGSIAQAELDIMPEPYAKVMNTPTPPGLDACAHIVYLSLSRGMSADDLRRISTRTEPAVVRAIPPGPEVARQPPAVVRARAIPRSRLELHLPQIRELAISACRSPSNARPLYMELNEEFYRTIPPRGAIIEFTIEYHTLGLDGCARRLYGDLVQMVLDQTYWQVGQANWFVNKVASYAPAPPARDGGSRGGGSTGGNGFVTAPPPAVIHDPEGEALEQLREIERRRRWGLPPRR